MQGEERVAVLLGGYGEIEEYEEFEDYNERSLRLLVSKVVKLPDFAIPFLARALDRKNRKEWESQNRYHSPHNAIFERQRAGIEKNLQAHYGDRVAVFKAFNFCDGHLPDQVLAEIRAQGFRKLVVYPLEVVDSVFTSGLILQQVNEALGDDHAWLDGMRYLPSFAERSDYHQLLADRVVEGMDRLQGDYAPFQIGIMLLVHGCPLDARGYETGIRDSEILYRGVQELLVDRFPSISVGWMNHPTPGKWTSPDMDQAAENLISTGAKAIVYAPIGFVTENHETMLDVGYAIEKVRGRVETVHLESPNDDPAFLEMAARWIEPLIDQLS